MSPTLRAALRPEPAVDLGDTRRCRGDRGYVTDVRLPVVLAVGVLIVVVTVFAIRLAYGSADDGTKPRALILGDSITDHGQRELNDTIGPLYALSIDGQDNFRIDDQLPVAERWATRPFQQVVINLGTNDAVQGWPLDQSSANLSKLVGMFPNAECIHLTTINEHLKGRSSEDGTVGGCTERPDSRHGRGRSTDLHRRLERARRGQPGPRCRPDIRWRPPDTRRRSAADQRLRQVDGVLSQVVSRRHVSSRTHPPVWSARRSPASPRSH